MRRVEGAAGAGSFTTSGVLTTGAGACVPTGAAVSTMPSFLTGVAAGICPVAGAPTLLSLAAVCSASTLAVAVAPLDESLDVAGVGVAAGAAPFAPSSKVKIGWSTATVSPALTRISLMVPLTVEGTSKTALSVSSSKTDWSCSMVSPGATRSLATTPESALSPRVGNLYSAIEKGVLRNLREIRAAAVLAKQDSKLGANARAKR